ncbi:MAG: hypothetical protein ACE5JS_13210 [Nitrospinota bacterium]
MEVKNFEHLIKFYMGFPIVTLNLVNANGESVKLPLLFDTGASEITLRHDLYTLFGVSSWDSGELHELGTAGGDKPVRAYRYHAKVEFLGKSFDDCPISLMVLPKNPLYVGLFGRRRVFEGFGFGFWEKSRELYVTSNP